HRSTTILFPDHCFGTLRGRHSFPTRRSSDLLGGADAITVNDLSGTDVTQVFVNLNSSAGTGDAQADIVTVNGTAGADNISITGRSEEHTSELQSRGHLVCRLLPEKKNSVNSL